MRQIHQCARDISWYIMILRRNKRAIFNAVYDLSNRTYWTFFLHKTENKYFQVGPRKSNFTFPLPILMWFWPCIVVNMWKIKCQLDATDVLIAVFCLLNMFRVPLCPLSGAQEYYTVVADCGIWCCSSQVVGPVWSWGLGVRFAGCCSILPTGHIEWRALNCFPRCQNSSYQNLFCLHRGLKNKIPEVTTKEEIPVKISAFRRLLDSIRCVSNCPTWHPNSSITNSLDFRFVYK